jgi:hypothetical protein
MNTILSHTHPVSRPSSTIRSVCSLPLKLGVAALLVAVPGASLAGEVYVRLWGPTSPYDPAIKAASGSVSKILSRDFSFWTFRNYAAASMGGLAISAREAVVSAGGGNQFHQGAQSTAYWEDTMTINAPGLTGALGVMTVTYRVNGHVTFDGTFNQTYAYNRAYLRNEFLIGGNPVDYTEHERTNVGQGQGSNFLNADRTIQAGFTFGTPFSIRHTLYSETAIDARNGVGKISEVVVSALWKGITVQHQSTPVTNFTASSSTVPVYSQQLPPPLPPLTYTAQPTQLVFTWPEPAACVLKVSQNLRDWAPSVIQPTVNNMIKTVTVPITNGVEYFRLETTP